MLGKILSPTFWAQTIVSTIITMCMIYAIKVVATKYNVPVLATVSEGI